MARYNIYAVACGVDPQTKQEVYNLKFHTWDNCKPYVVGVNGAKYKGFLTESEADAWLNKNTTEIAEAIKDDKKDINPKSMHEILREELKEIMNSTKSHVDDEFVSICKNLGLSTHNTEQILKKMFIDTIKYLEDNGCINELPFK